jgi:hypothetical protein
MKTLSDILTELVTRPDTDSLITLPHVEGTTDLNRVEDLAAAAVGVWVLERVAEADGTRFPLRDLRRLRERLIEPFDRPQVMALEVEAYEVLRWLVGLERPPEQASDTTDRPIQYDPEATVMDLLRRAIAEGFDVDIQYYTQSRGSLNKRRVSPKFIRAETYLNGYCHTREDDRVFRISRIAEIVPAGGIPIDGLDTEKKQGHLF